MQWLALHLPDLPLEVFARGQAQQGRQKPLAVAAGERLVVCNRAASAKGIRAGLTEGAARTLCGDLRILERRTDEERAALERLAAWAMCFSDQVSLVPPQALVLEAGRSLRLFGGAAALCRQAQTGLAALGYQARCTLAPTPAGALTLAVWGLTEPVADHHLLRRRLAALPIAALRLDPRAEQELARMGLDNIGALLRLPRAGLAERFGDALPTRLERLLGERPDPRHPFTPPSRYHGRLELPAEVPEAAALVFACRRLIDELAGLLLGRQAGVQRLDWTLLHADQPPTRFQLGAAAPGRDPERWLLLLRERLERLTLPAPVRAITLDSETLRPLAAHQFDLLPRTEPGAAPDTDLLDRLRARLGGSAVRGLCLVGDHRPERGWRWRGADEATTANLDDPGLPRRDRPLWLLPSPVPLAEQNRRPCLDGPLHLGHGCERIETGWWDDSPVARDYYVATTARGERLWIYREMSGSRRWFLHGLFGDWPSNRAVHDARPGDCESFPAS
jgi:protein ImuB